MIKHLYSHNAETSLFTIYSGVDNRILTTLHLPFVDAHKIMRAIDMMVEEAFEEGTKAVSYRIKGICEQIESGELKL